MLEDSGMSAVWMAGTSPAMTLGATEPTLFHVKQAGWKT